MRAKPDNTEQNIDTDCFIEVRDAHNHKVVVRSHEMLQLIVKNDIITVTLPASYNTPPYTITDSLTHLLLLLPSDKFIRVRDNTAVHTDFVKQIIDGIVTLNCGDFLVFSRRGYCEFLHRGKA